MKRKTLLVLVLSILAISLSAATAYQKKTYQIYAKYYTLFKDGYSHELSTEDILMFRMVGAEEITAMTALAALEYMPPSKVNKYIEQMEAELKKAESLMTKEERIKKQEEQKKKQEEQKKQKYLEEQARIEKAKQDSINARMETSVGYLEVAIQNKLTKWKTKGEFEKTTDYQKRLENKSITELTAAYDEYFPKATFTVEPLRYIADKETYILDISYTLKFKEKSFSHEITANIPIGIDTARQFSQNTPKISIIDCVWGEYKHNITPQSYKIVINGNIYNSTSKANDLVINGADVAPDLQELKSMSYNFSDLHKQRIERKEQILLDIEQYNSRMVEQNLTSKIKIQSSPYYKRLPEYIKKDFIHTYEPKTYTAANDITEIEDYYTNIQSLNDSALENDPIQPIKKYLRMNYRQEFVEAYFEEHPDSAQYLKKEWLEYKCNYPYQQLDGFVIAYLQNEVDDSLRNCREKIWNEYGKYYNSREEFDHDYEEDENAYVIRKKEYEKLEVKIFDMQRCFTVYAGNQRISDINLMGANSHTNFYVHNMVQLLNDLSKFPELQEEAAEIIILNNGKAQKEYDKNGQLFGSKAEFITTYFSTEYKTILKSLKKQ